MNSFETYLPVLYPLPQGKLLVFLKGKELHLVLITVGGELYRHIVDDVQEFKEDVGYAFNDNFPVIFLNSLKDLRLELQPQKATIVVILAKREVTGENVVKKFTMNIKTIVILYYNQSIIFYVGVPILKKSIKQ
jgi:hypothetical protein